jgi:hypothetical protein
MRTEQDLLAAFRALEDTADAYGTPDFQIPAASPTQRPSHGGRTLLSALAVAAAVISVLAVAAVLTNHSETPADPATHSTVPASTSSSPASTSSSPASTSPSVSDGFSTIAAGWLPGPARQVDASNQPGFEQRDYDVKVDGVDMDVIIYLESGSQLPSRTEAGSGYRDITINGHPGREFIADNATIVAFNLGNGTIAYAGPSVVAPTGTVTTARITAIAEHVAREIQFNQHDPIPVNRGLQPTQLPS